MALRYEDGGNESDRYIENGTENMFMEFIISESKTPDTYNVYVRVSKFVPISFSQIIYSAE